ncbi:hypothetical protein M9H77_07268 [Catharanthus roseus]|uniref:Uncharacterized protein n=1 Tax=Catharanthus roseus TaxID=4058 RepID=A0ACC0BUV0_CATRO|nr:hypothetical protein M9H77_07268 [Catharanthus roseus]
MPKLRAANVANWKRKNSRRGKNRAYCLYLPSMVGFVQSELGVLNIYRPVRYPTVDDRQRGQSHIKGHGNSQTQRGYGNYNHHGSFGMLIQSTHRFHNGGRHTTPRGGRRGGLRGQGYNRPQEEVPRHEVWNEDNLVDDYGENPNVGQ